MNRFVKIVFVYIAGLASIFGLAFAGYYQFIYRERIKLEIKIIDAVELTSMPKIDGLKATFEYKDTLVTNLWKIRFYINNKGNKTIIGKGDRKDILTDGLSVFLKDSLNIISIKSNDKNFPIEVTKNDYCLILNFQQWKVGEYVEIIGYIENYTKNTPSVFINDRDIIESEINYSKYEPIEPKGKAKLIDSLPNGLQSFLKWIIILTIILLDFWSIFAIRKELKKGDDLNSKTLAIVAFIVWLILTIIYTMPLLWILEL